MNEAMHVFISYAQRERPTVRSVIEGLRVLGHEVWLDESLTGGQAWWDAVLSQIRGCDVFLAVVSPASLESEACSAERGYARQLRKMIVPVMIERVPPELLPPDVAVLQVVDYTRPAQEAAFRLAAALAAPASPAAPPSPLPPPPAIPLSYLVDLSNRVHAPSLTLDDQNALIARLKTAVHRPEDAEAAVELLEALDRRPDLYRGPAGEVEKLLSEARAGVQPGPAPPDGPAASTTVVQCSASLKSKTKSSRRLVVNSRKPHVIEWKVTFALGTSYGMESVAVDNQVLKRRMFDDFQSMRGLPFTIIDDGVPVRASISSDWKMTPSGPWRQGKVKSFSLSVNGHIVYSDNG